MAGVPLGSVLPSGSTAAVSLGARMTGALGADLPLGPPAAPLFRARALRPAAPSALPAAVGLPSTVRLPVPSTPARSAALVPLVAALVAGMAQLLTDDGGVTVVEAGATGAGVAATGVAGWSLWQASASERVRLGRLTVVLAAWTLTQLARVGLGPTPTVASARAAVAAGALAAPLLAALALATLPRSVPLVVDLSGLNGPARAALGGETGVGLVRRRHGVHGPRERSRASVLTQTISGPAARAAVAAGAPLGVGEGRSLEARLAASLVTASRQGWDVAGFDVHYQPIVRLSDGVVVALEALARWTEPGHGPVPPLTFVAAAEDGGLVAALDGFVLGRACAEVAAGMPGGAGEGAPRLHVNISASRLSDPTLADTFRQALEVSGLDPARLVIEITETARIHDLGAAARVLEAVRALGASVAMDDVGAGHTTLAALHQLPVNIVKLDRGLIENPLGPGREARLGRSVITVARSLGAVVVAEGIERRAQRADLALLGCELGQGYLFARPAPLAALGPLLRSTAVVGAPATVVGGPETSEAGRRP
ncbi:EAL domain-containing protein [Frankia sp. AgB1.8]|nr:MULTISPECIES: EAL domain-containing protein [unclassified Frankia]MBL7618238.1 EAL domain-containing protein [Frankia sp. AgB1.8]